MTHMPDENDGSVELDPSDEPLQYTDEPVEGPGDDDVTPELVDPQDDE